MTVYYRFQSKRGLLEALFDDLAARGRIHELSDAFQQSDPLAALSEFIRVFIGFWTSARVLLRRLHGMATTHPELETALHDRGERRRHGLNVIVRRIAAERGPSASTSLEDVVDVLFTITSFETFDALARGKRRGPDVAALVQSLALAALRETGWLKNS